MPEIAREGPQPGSDDWPFGSRPERVVTPRETRQPERTYERLAILHKHEVLHLDDFSCFNSPTADLVRGIFATSQSQPRLLIYL